MHAAHIPQHALRYLEQFRMRLLVVILGGGILNNGLTGVCHVLFDQRRSLLAILILDGHKYLLVI